MYEIKDNILYFENILDSTETVEKLFQLFKFRLMSSFFFFLLSQYFGCYIFPTSSG